LPRPERDHEDRHQHDGRAEADDAAEGAGRETGDEDEQVLQSRLS